MQTQKISYKRHRFPPQIIAHVVWLCVRFNLSLREVEELMLERGMDVSYRGIAFGSVSSRRGRKTSKPDYERSERAQKFTLRSPSSRSNFQTR